MKKSIRIAAILLSLALTLSLLTGCVGTALLFGALSGNETGAENETARQTETAEKPTDRETVGPSERETETEPETEEVRRPEVSEEETEAFREFTEDVMALLLQGNTLNVHYMLAFPEAYGIDDSEVSFGSASISGEDVEEYRAFLNECLEGLEEYDYDLLDEEAKLTYDSLKWYLQTEKEGIGLERFYEPLGPNAGIQAILPVELEEYRFYRETDVQNYLGLLRRVPEFFRELVKLEEERAAAGVFMEDRILVKTIDQCREFLAGRENSFLLSSFVERLNELDLEESKKTAYVEENRAAVEESLYPAYEELIEALSGMKGLNKTAGGLANYEDGDRYFAYILKAKTGSDMTPEEMADRIDRAIEEGFLQMVSIYSRNPSIESIMERDIFPTTEPEEALRILKEKMKADFPEIPEVDYAVKYLDASLREYMNPACYMIPPMDLSVRNSILINCDPGDEPEDLFITLAHEGYPGHLYQHNYTANHSRFLLRSVIGTTGFAEGYAKYVEDFAYRYIDGLSEEEAEFLMLNSRISLFIYARTDLGIHYEGWTEEDISDFLSDFFEQPDEIAAWMYEMMLVDPGTYEQYAVGELEILDILAEAEEQSGFSLYEFHRQLLEDSEAPFSVLRARILGE